MTDLAGYFHGGHPDRAADQRLTTRRLQFGRDRRGEEVPSHFEHASAHTLKTAQGDTSQHSLTIRPVTMASRIWPMIIGHRPAAVRTASRRMPDLAQAAPGGAASGVAPRDGVPRGGRERR